MIGVSIGAAAYHVRTLRDLGVVQLADEIRVRGAVEHLYTLVDDRATAVNDPVADLQKVCGAISLPPSDGAYPLPVPLDDEARQALRAILDELRPRVKEVVRAAADRAYGPS